MERCCGLYRGEYGREQLYAVSACLSAQPKDSSCPGQVRKAAFRGTWGLAQLDGEPRKPNFYLAAGLGHFVVRVKQTARTSLASVLVKFKTDSVSLRVLNNCTSDFSLQCRTHLYVPGRIISPTFAPLSRLLLEQSDILVDCLACSLEPQPIAWQTRDLHV